MFSFLKKKFQIKKETRELIDDVTGLKVQWNYTISPDINYPIRTTIDFVVAPNISTGALHDIAVEKCRFHNHMRLVKYERSSQNVKVVVDIQNRHNAENIGHTLIKRIAEAFRDWKKAVEFVQMFEKTL